MPPRVDETTAKKFILAVVHEALESGRDTEGFMRWMLLGDSAEYALHVSDGEEFRRRFSTSRTVEGAFKVFVTYYGFVNLLHKPACAELKAGLTPPRVVNTRVLYHPAYQPGRSAADINRIPKMRHAGPRRDQGSGRPARDGARAETPPRTVAGGFATPPPRKRSPPASFQPLAAYSDEEEEGQIAIATRSGRGPLFALAPPSPTPSYYDFNISGAEFSTPPDIADPVILRTPERGLRAPAWSDAVDDGATILARLHGFTPAAPRRRRDERT